MKLQTIICLFVIYLRNGMDVRFKVPSNFYISGQSQCGKSYLVRRLLYYLNDLFHPVPSKVVYCYGEYQKEFDQLHGVEFIEGFPEDLRGCPPKSGPFVFPAEIRCPS